MENKKKIIGKRTSKLSRIATTPLESQNIRTTSRKALMYDCYGSLESVAWIWRSLGMFPITIDDSVGTRKYGISKFLAVYSFLVFAACFGNFVKAMIQVTPYIEKNMRITLVTIILRATASMLCMILSNVWRILRHKELSESINEMSVQNVILEKMNCRFNYESDTKIIRAYVWTTFVTMLFFVGYDLYNSIESSPYTSSIAWILWTIPLVVQVVNLTILVSLVGLLGLKFRALNEKIRSVVTRANTSSPKVIVTSDVCAENLRLISKAHYNICAVGKRINAIFDWVVIITVITAFIILSTTLYYIFDEVQSDGETDYKEIFTFIHWEFIHGAPIIVIVIICNWTAGQGIYAGKLIHEIRVEKTDSRLYQAVKSFSLQLHHQKLEFTAGGFFPLNSTLLQTMVGNITTYLVILIQFQPKLN